MFLYLFYKYYVHHMASIWHAKYSKMLLINSEARNVDAKILKFLSRISLYLLSFFLLIPRKKLCKKVYFITEIKNIA